MALFSDILIFFVIARKTKLKLWGFWPPPRSGGGRVKARSAAAGAAARRRPKPPKFKFRLASDHETKSKYSEKSANYSAKSTIFSQKQRLYTYDRDVYANPETKFTLLNCLSFRKLQKITSNLPYYTVLNLIFEPFFSKSEISEPHLSRFSGFFRLWTSVILDQKNEIYMA